MTNSTIQSSRQIAVRRFQKALGNTLSRQYTDVIAEPVPDAFLQLLESINRKNPQRRQLPPSTMIVSRLPSSH